MKKEILQLLRAYEQDLITELEETNSVSLLLTIITKLVAVGEIRQIILTIDESEKYEKS